MQFLSTPSVRRATTLDELTKRGFGISIHALREEGDGKMVLCHKLFTFISIHALREEGDCVVFLNGRRLGISIHALREEGDAQLRPHPGRLFYFYSRPPRGGRRYSAPATASRWKFLSTPSARRATLLGTAALIQSKEISIHALREEGDHYLWTTRCNLCDFYPRPP